jgi:hypothetical protein
MTEQWQTLRHPLEGGRIPPSLEGFLPFVNVSDDKLRQKFVEVLRELYNETRESWRPGGCYSTEYLTRVIGQLQARQGLVGTKFIPMSYCGSCHFYFTAVLEGESQALIVDPFGVPPQGTTEGAWMRDEGIITPFFGELELAPERHKQVYSKGESIEGKGFHYFSM